ncbi:MAG: amino acid ABC transporter ATP-binding protein [Candidatus Coatesbacteria bacterium]|nr:MAG: amino acid ABC transporter ATP-binding protein [Candidatus Coatesbacteria bacterium]
MPDPIVELKSVRKTLKSKTDGSEVNTPVFNGLDLTISVGERIGIIGPSGSGKTTLLKLVNRLEDADEGTISVDGRDVFDWDARALRRKAALVLQKPYIFEGTVYDNVAFPYTAANEKTPPRKTVEELLSEAGLPDVDTARPAAALSVGQQQRVCLARSLATEPSVLMLDETTSSLDPNVAAGVLKKIYGRCRSDRLTLIHVTHEVPKLRDLDRIAVIAGGTITEEGTPERILEGPISAATKDFLAGFS